MVGDLVRSRRSRRSLSAPRAAVGPRSAQAKTAQPRKAGRMDRFLLAQNGSNVNVLDYLGNRLELEGSTPEAQVVVVHQVRGGDTLVVHERAVGRAEVADAKGDPDEAELGVPPTDRGVAQDHVARGVGA